MGYGFSELKAVNQSFDMSNCLVCKAVADEAAQVSNVVNTAIYTADYFRKEGCERISIPEVLDTILNSDNACWYVIKAASEESKTQRNALKTQVLGTLLYQSKTPTEASIHMFASKVHGLGIGTKLLNAIELVASEEHKNKLSLWCANVSGLVNYYQNAGFTSNGNHGMYDAAYLKPHYIGKVSIIEMEKSIGWNHH